MASDIPSNLIPHFSQARRIPLRYRNTLALKVMKRHQCAVLGSAPGVLTVAITDQCNGLLIETLSKITERTIFPVLVGPARMRLLIRRLEYSERSRYRRLKSSSFLYPRQVDTITAVIALLIEEGGCHWR